MPYRFWGLLDSCLAAMVSLGKNGSDIQSKALRFKQHDKATLKASFDFFDDESELVNFMRTQRTELERILPNDLPGDSDSK
jgi:hypothetical protein